MPVAKSSFAVCFANRGGFPASLHEAARREMRQVLERLGHKVLMLDASATRYGAVQTRQEGLLYAEFLRQHRSDIDGVILCLPNFGDETGALVALGDANLPILVQAYPDQLDKMAPDQRRDAFCGKFSIMNVFCQAGVNFTALTPHVAHPDSDAFKANVDHFDRLCRVVAGMRRMTVGAIGARTTPFKTVRIDEQALQRHGITTETFDLSQVFIRMNQLDDDAAAVKAKYHALTHYANWDAVPDKAIHTLARLGVVLDQLVDEYALDALAVRCWSEMQQQIGVSSCILLSEMNDRHIPAACEVDIGSAVMMFALQLASGHAPGCLDWNNNYGDEPDKCILFHCGPIPQSLMAGDGKVIDHVGVASSLGPGCAWGCNVGRIAPTPFTFGNLTTTDGRLKVYVGQGRFTADPIPEAFFGCAGVAEVTDLQNTLRTIGLTGHRHHTAVAPGHLLAPVREALETYLGYDVTVV